MFNKVVNSKLQCLDTLTMKKTQMISLALLMMKMTGEGLVRELAAPGQENIFFYFQNKCGQW